MSNVTGPLQAQNNLSDVADVPTTRGNLGVASVPVVISIPGLPPAGAVVNLPVGISLTIPASLTGTSVYAGTNATANATVTLNKISGGVTIALGTITKTPTSATSVTLSGAGGSVIAGDVLQFILPSPQDATLANFGITLLATRT